MIFVDTSALYAVLDRDDDCHEQARNTWRRLLRASATLVTHNYVLIESCALAQSRIGPPALRAIQESIVTRHFLSPRPSHALCRLISRIPDPCGSMARWRGEGVG